MSKAIQLGLCFTALAVYGAYLLFILIGANPNSSDIHYTHIILFLGVANFSICFVVVGVSYLASSTRAFCKPSGRLNFGVVASLWPFLLPNALLLWLYQRFSGSQRWHRIDDTVFAGCFPDHVVLELLETHNIDCVIDLTAELSQLNSIIQFQDIKYCNIPILDGLPASCEQIDLAVKTLIECARSHRRAYVHCALGRGRTGMIVAAYLTRKNDLRLEDAVKLMKSKRPQLHPNSGQLKAVSDWQKTMG